MEPVAATAEVLAYKVLNRLTDKAWVDWAYSMLVAGFETEHLLILAGMQEPLEYFEMRSLTDNVLAELRLDYSNTDEVIANYASYLSKQGLTNEIPSFKVLKMLADVYIELDYYAALEHFYYLYYAKEDLEYSVDQWYLNGVDRSNIDQTITDYFQQWIKE